MALWKVLDPRSKRSAVSTAGSSNSFCLGSGLKFGQVRLSGISTPSHLTPDPLLLVYRTQMGHPFHNRSGLKFGQGPIRIWPYGKSLTPDLTTGLRFSAILLLVLGLTSHPQLDLGSSVQCKIIIIILFFCYGSNFLS